MAEVYEKDLEYDLAVANLKEAARLFELEKFNKTDADKAYIKIAELLSRDCSHAAQDKVIEAIKVRAGEQIFKKMGTKYTENNMLRHSARELFFKGALLFLAIDDDIGLEKFVDQSSDSDPFFNNSMEHKFLLRLLESWRENDVDQAAHEMYARLTQHRPGQADDAGQVEDQRARGDQAPAGQEGGRGEEEPAAAGVGRADGGAAGRPELFALLIVRPRRLTAPAYLNNRHMRESMPRHKNIPSTVRYASRLAFLTTPCSPRRPSHRSRLAASPTRRAADALAAPLVIIIP